MNVFLTLTVISIISRLSILCLFFTVNLVLLPLKFVSNMKYKNNPFNIRYSKYNKWFGQIHPKNGFCQFRSFDYGVRACIIILTFYINKGFNTVEKIITRFAPPSENDTSKYIESVCRITRLRPCDKFTSIHSIRFYFLLCAMAKMETGTDLSIIDIDNVIDYFNLPDVQCRD